MITGLITSTSMSFVGLALNYGFQPDRRASALRRTGPSSNVAFDPQETIRWLSS
jgi:hypothetical protein